MFKYLLHTNMRYLLSLLTLYTKMYHGRTYVTHKNMVSCICTFYVWKCVMPILVLLFSEFEQMHIKMFQKV